MASEAVLEAALAVVIASSSSEEENGSEQTRKTLKVLSAVVGNLLKSPTEAKFRRLPKNKVVSAAIANVEGAPEFLAAIGFEDAGDMYVVNGEPNWAALEAAKRVLAANIPPATTKGVETPEEAEEKDIPKAAPKRAAKTKAEEEYEQRKRETEARLVELKKKAEEERKKAELLKKRMQQEQAELRSRRVTASSAASDLSFGARAKTWSDIGVDMKNSGGGG